MTLNIDFNAIKNGLVSGYHNASAKASEWLGRGITLIKSGKEAALPCLQDKRIAAVSLVAVNLILIEVSDLFTNLIGRWMPHRTDGQKIFRDMVQISLGLASLAAGVVTYSKYAKLPLSPLAITGISVGTIFVRACMTRDGG